MKVTGGFAGSSHDDYDNKISIMMTIGFYCVCSANCTDTIWEKNNKNMINLLCAEKHHFCISYHDGTTQRGFAYHLTVNDIMAIDDLSKH